MAPAAKDDMIEYFDAQRASGNPEPASQIHVLRAARRRIAGRVIVSDDYSRGAKQDRAAEHNARINNGRTLTAARNNLVAPEIVFLIEREENEVLLIFIQARVDLPQYPQDRRVIHFFPRGCLGNFETDLESFELVDRLHFVPLAALLYENAV